MSIQIVYPTNFIHFNMEDKVQKVNQFNTEGVTKYRNEDTAIVNGVKIRKSHWVGFSDKSSYSYEIVNTGKEF